MLDVIRRHAGDKARIAVDNLNWPEADKLRAGGVTLGSGQELMELARSIKGPDEIKAMRCSVYACETTVAEMRAELRPGIVAEAALGPDDALDLALAWDGDAYILYETGSNQRCLAATMQFDTAGHAQQAAEALMTAGLQVTAEERTLEATRCLQL